MNSNGHDTIGDDQGVLDEIRKALARDGEPSEWSDGDKLRLFAALLDEADLARGVDNMHEVQDDLRRMAGRLDD